MLGLAMPELNNNLRNVKNRDPIFRRLSRFILDYALGEEDQFKLETQMLEIIAGDSYFTFYSFMPTVEDKNEHPVLETVRRFISDYILSDSFEKVHNVTKLDHELSMVYSITFMKELLKMIKQDQKLSNAFSKQRKIIPRMLPSSGWDSQASDRLLRALEKAAQRASRTAKHAKDLRSYIGGTQAGRKPGTFEKLLDLANLVTNVYGAERIITMAKEITIWIPRFTTIKKVKSKFGDELGGYNISRDPAKATPKEIALLSEIFEYKMATGMISKEKQFPTIGGYYVLIDKCLSDDTLITLSDGREVTISDIKPGDEVLSVNLDYKEPKVSNSKVVKVIDSGLRETITLKTDLGSLRLTSNHILPVVRGPFIIEIPACMLRVGDKLLALYNKSYDERLTDEIALTTVQNIEKSEKASTYDIMLKDHHRFVANRIIVHNSGSMLGPKTVWARSVALSLLKLAMRAKARYFLRFFDTQVYPDCPVSDPIEAIEYILTVWSDGGTDIDKAIVIACKDFKAKIKDIEKYTNTIVVITDGQDEIDTEIVREALESVNARLVSVMVQGDNVSLRKVSNQYFTATLDVKGALKLVEAIR